MESSDVTTAYLPLKGGYDVTLRIPRSMSAESWNHMMEYLDVMKRGYVRRNDPNLAVDLRRGDDGLGIG